MSWVTVYLSPSGVLISSSSAAIESTVIMFSYLGSRLPTNAYWADSLFSISALAGFTRSKAPAGVGV
eukprot:11267927-Prorocentrum_lima.AAC.1